MNQVSPKHIFISHVSKDDKSNYLKNTNQYEQF